MNQKEKDAINGVMYATPANMRKRAQFENEPIAAKGVFSYCRSCGEQVSASAGDYFMQAADKSLEHCGEPMILAYLKSNIIAV